jgi:hypothetical protein
MSIIDVYALPSEYQSFTTTSQYNDTTSKIPFGYHYEDHKWCNLYNTSTGKKVGILIFNNQFHNIDYDKKISYASNNYVIYIESRWGNEYKPGSLSFVFNYKTPLSTTIFPNGDINNGSFIAGTNEYYLKSFDVTVQLISKLILNIKFYPRTTIPRDINNSTNLHVISDESKFNTFRDISDIDIKVNKIPFGYHYRDIKWVLLQNPDNYNVIGKILLINNFHNTDSLVNDGYCNDNIVVFINSELPIGSIKYVINFYNTSNSTGFIPGSTIFPTTIALTGAYYGRYVTVKIVTSNELLTDIYFTITPPL